MWGGHSEDFVTRGAQIAARVTARGMRKYWRFAITLWNDQSGIILPYVTLMLFVIVGVSVLAIDGARLMSLHTQLQNGADALALAGAAELDRLPDAEMRARTAVDRLLNNSTSFGSAIKV